MTNLCTWLPAYIFRHHEARRWIKRSDTVIDSNFGILYGPFPHKYHYITKNGLDFPLLLSKFAQHARSNTPWHRPLGQVCAALRSSVQESEGSQTPATSPKSLDLTNQTSTRMPQELLDRSETCAHVSAGCFAKTHDQPSVVVSRRCPCIHKFPF